MAKVNNVEVLQTKVIVAIKNSLKSKTLLESVGKLARDRIYSITKTGYSMFKSKKQKLERLSPGYIEYRRRYQSENPTGHLFSPTRSNLTLTGQLLQALTHKIDAARGIIEIYVENSVRRPSRPGEQTMTNAEVAAEVAKNGRPFMGLDEDAVKRLKNEIIKDLRRALRREGLRK